MKIEWWLFIWQDSVWVLESKHKYPVDAEAQIKKMHSHLNCKIDAVYVGKQPEDML